MEWYSSVMEKHSSKVGIILEILGNIRKTKRLEKYFTNTIFSIMN